MSTPFASSAGSPDGARPAFGRGSLGAAAATACGALGDLAHAFDVDILHRSSFAPAQRTVIYHQDPGVGSKKHGFLAEEWRLQGQWGAHVDPPAQFVRVPRFLHRIAVQSWSCRSSCRSSASTR